MKVSGPKPNFSRGDTRIQHMSCPIACPMPEAQVLLCR